MRSQCLVKAVQTDERDHATIAALPKATYGILLFGTPHKGLLIDDIKHMVAGDDEHPRTELLEQIKDKSDLLMYQLVDFKNHTRDWKIVSFYETLQTRQLKFVRSHYSSQVGII
jgi:protein SERAC1